MSKHTTALPVCNVSLRVSRSFFISICIQARPAVTSKHATSRRKPSTDVQVEHKLGPRLQNVKHECSWQMTLKNEE